MNIFWLDEDIQKASQYMVDKHVCKMILETAQLLTSVYYYTGQPSPYRLTHKDHPCSVWARTSLSNWNLLRQFGLAMQAEYHYRYEKYHKSGLLIARLEPPNIPAIGLTPKPLCMPDECKCDDVVQSYRNYYNGYKRHLFSWTKREVPDWIT